MKAAVVTLPAYERQAKRLLSVAEKAALEDHITEAPEVYPLIPGTGGVRKARWARAGKGKRGGVRVVFYYQASPPTVYMLTLYAKNEKANLTEDDKKDMKKIVDRMKGRFLQ